MTISGIEKRSVSIEVSKKDFSDLMMKKLYEIHDWKSYWYITGTKICYDEEVYGSHTFDRMHTVREASKEDKKTFRILSDIRSKLYK